MVLLGIVMPVMAAATAGVAAATLGLGVTAALLLGGGLCPTDPVLASGVVTGELGVLLLRRLPILLLVRPLLLLSWRDAGYLGWFGPVGVSALFYLTLQADRLGADTTLLAAGSLVIAASVVLHGLTGTPGRAG